MNKKETPQFVPLHSRIKQNHFDKKETQQKTSSSSLSSSPFVLLHSQIKNNLDKKQTQHNNNNNSKSSSNNNKSSSSSSSNNKKKTSSQSQFVPLYSLKNNHLYKKKTGVIITTHGNNGVFVKQAVQSFLAFMPSNIYLVVYVNESNDEITLQLKELFPSIDVVYVVDQHKNGGLTGTWNQGIERCFMNKCENVILSNDDLFILPNIHYILQELDRCNDRELKYFGPLTNEPGPSNASQYHLFARREEPYRITQNLNGFFMAFPKHVLLVNKFDRANYFNPAYTFGGNEVEWNKRFLVKGGKPMVVPRSFVYHYKLKSWRKQKVVHNNPICIYTAVINNYENDIYIHKHLDYDVLYFTDCLHKIEQCMRQNIKPMLVFNNFKNENSILFQRTLKSCPHRHLPHHYKQSIWIDGNVFPLFRNLGHLDLSKNVICFRHPCRTNVYAEMVEILNKKLITQTVFDKMNHIYHQYRFNSHKSNLHETCILFRNHTHPTMLVFGEKWCELINVCHRDQASFDFLLWLYKIDYVSIPFHQRPISKTKHSPSGMITRYSMTTNQTKK